MIIIVLLTSDYELSLATMRFNCCNWQKVQMSLQTFLIHIIANCTVHFLITNGSFSSPVAQSAKTRKSNRLVRRLWVRFPLQMEKLFAEESARALGHGTEVMGFMGCLLQLGTQ
jgi:hypothetical protein